MNNKNFDRGALAPLVIALDLEFNQPSQKIIQIGAACGDLRSGAVVGRFSQLVNPGEALDPRIAELCGIDPQDLVAAPDLQAAWCMVEAWLGGFPDRQMNPVTWGGGDSRSLQEQLGAPDDWAFGRRHVDAKTVFIAWRAAHLRPAVGGLKTSMKKLGLAFEGRPHDAADDAINAFRVYHRLLRLIRGSETL